MAFTHKVVAGYLALLDDPWLYQKQNLRPALLYLGREIMSVHACVYVCACGGNPQLQILVLQNQPQRVQLDMPGQFSLRSLIAPSVWLLRELRMGTVRWHLCKELGLEHPCFCEQIL